MNEKTNWNWQLSVLQQKVGEWVEYQLSKLQIDLPQLPDGWSIDGFWLKLLTWLFWLLLSLFLVWVGWRLWREFSPYVYAWLSEVNTNSGEKISTSLLSASGWLEKSQQLSRQGNYSEAIRCLYLAMLQNLNDTSIAPHQPSRTDGEYLQLLQTSVTPIQPYETLITTHEQLCFGNTNIGGDNYQQCREAYQEIFPE